MTSLFRDPVSGLTHLAGAFLGVIGLIYLLAANPVGAPFWTTAALIIYGASCILLYSSSAAYHLLQVSPAARVKLRQLDHSMVSVFIAGTYTPFCVIGLHSTLGYTVLTIIWILAAFGLLMSLYWLNAPRWITAGVYVLMGWFVVFAIYPLAQAISAEALWLLVGGGVFYSLGALIYAVKWPNPWPPVFGFHEVWHLFVLAGSACHYASVLRLI